MHEVIKFDGDVSYASVVGLMSELQRSTARRKVAIDSPGGTFEFFSILGPSLHRQHFTSIGCDVRSAAIVLHLLGSRRYATKDATFFFHEVRAITPYGGIITICDMERALEFEEAIREQKEGVEEALKNLRNAQDWMLTFIKEKTGLSKPTFLDLMRNETILSAKDAIRFGLAERIVSEDEFTTIH